MIQSIQHPVTGTQSPASSNMVKPIAIPTWTFDVLQEAGASTESRRYPVSCILYMYLDPSMLPASFACPGFLLFRRQSPKTLSCKLLESKLLVWSIAKWKHSSLRMLQTADSTKGDTLPSPHKPTKLPTPKHTPHTRQTSSPPRFYS